MLGLPANQDANIFNLVSMAAVPVDATAVQD
jgi:hypothetical protein